MSQKQKIGYIIGLDEVGRGALAGPVVVAGLIMPKNWRPKLPLSKKPLKDSKKLKPQTREAWFRYVKNQSGAEYALARVYPKGIDRLNISAAANLAALRVYQRLFMVSPARTGNAKIYLDGGLFLKNREMSGKLKARTIIKGDEKINAIKLASIIAKVNRDKYMVSLHKEFPVYGFAGHKGYGTKKHKRAIKKHGPSPAHRLTFI